ncbi:hypothetical protein HMPREF6485_2694 [Segatella buccae ATCC 33574]|uniref:Uncharacterized protein n=1 Tax=Segatella buccae ATCC 33574 TaxID=873513 RepID=E6KAQ8_9BACT|nr:hypothetical protein HMPREF6485_2694 [Segatella buccae ATCC 33574]
MSITGSKFFPTRGGSSLGLPDGSCGPLPEAGGRMKDFENRKNR